MKTYAVSLLLGLSLACVSSASGRAAETIFAEGVESIFHDDLVINADETGRLIEVMDRRVLRTADISDAGKFSYTYDPDHQTFRIIEAWVEQEDGKRTEVAPETVLIRPSRASENAPGFVSTLTATLLIPQVVVGSKIHVKVESHTFKPFSATGYNAFFFAPLLRASDVNVTIQAPADLPLSLGWRNGFKVTDTTQAGQRLIRATAQVRDVSVESEERHMPPFVDLMPLLTVSTLKGYEDLGRRYHVLAAGKDAVTPEIQALADQVTAGKTGREAAQSLYDWLARNIRYVAVYLSDEAGYVPHDAAAVLKAGYGDCKDHVVLLQALLKARGIRSEPVIVKWTQARKDWPAPETGAFNHMILYLPDYDLYANPTDKFAPFGVLDYALTDKQVLHATAEPTMRRTPGLKPEDAVFTTEGAITIAADGSMTGTATATATPLLSIYLRHALSTEKRRKEGMKTAAADLPQPSLGQLTTTDPQDIDLPFDLTMSWRAARAVRLSGFIMPDLPDFAPNDPPQTYLDTGEARRFPVLLGPKVLNWRFTVTPPADRSFVVVPDDTHVENAAGSYEAHYRSQDGSLLVSRRLVLKPMEMSADGYAAVDALARAWIEDQSSVVALRKAPGKS
ncbi:DUF3857 domain-containing protein [Rhizobium sp. SSA_523]|uniref:DUF3857 domain-containing protein n=1 Tax=Rhizobium sp. SSA_523 TaxID=2952477 RepID=UPI002091BC92|nr:DUF3857 domain-containing protein [Rhizobium sp. SSA_523]MCO5730604.1 DUF3857 domain-containing protein [Rhizobium sp. SSA_523]WKC24565.1 DUF3857 domain-containing protein [Rhizobium sp. SSA_523]